MSNFVRGSDYRSQAVDVRVEIRSIDSHPGGINIELEIFMPHFMPIRIYKVINTSQLAKVLDYPMTSGYDSYGNLHNPYSGEGLLSQINLKDNKNLILLT